MAHQHLPKQDAQLLMAAEQCRMVDDHNGFGVQTQLAGSANINCKDTKKGGRTPLHAACRKGGEQVVAFLLASGADVNAHEDDMTTPLITAAGRGAVEVCKLLLKAGANKDEKDESFKTALDHAKEAGENEVVALLSTK